MKRVIDLVISLTLLVFLLPLIICIALLIRFKLGSPVIFKQKRPGKDGIPFYIYKFRTMNDQRDSNGKLLPDHFRLTKFGNFLRKYSLDELTQLLNVVKGELSLVGPRPLLMDYLPLYSMEQRRRHNVKPGITGWAQVNGRNLLSWDEKFKLDIWYVDNQNIWLDLKILILTLKQVFNTEGVQSKDYVTMPDFTGSKADEGM
ncbi:sugar transferase [Robertmurraya korlensis]|uniref:sugar transferase n=1 Tax=Robertmurraya korlensis TaxID=519977 RepID=UPI00203A9D0B|nr:sugar transferase [Robertmurraya korlensis]MCM3600549.1 sugar transferase [Robertmurraya korlensis]